MIKKSLFGLICLIILAYISFCASVYLLPQLYFYNPSSQKADLTKAINEGFNATEVSFFTKDGVKLYGWFIKPQPNKKTIVFYHGNSYNIAAFYHKLKPFAKLGYGIFIGEYRGFGGISGKINQSNLQKDALAVIDYLNQQGIQNSDIILYGMSLGSFTSTYTAANSQKDFAALILEVPFDSILNVVKQRIPNIFPFSLIIKDKYDNTSNISKINIPILIMLAENDKVVPKQRGENLFKYANHPKKLIIYPNAKHSNLFDYNNWTDIINWLNDK